MDDFAKKISKLPQYEKSFFLSDEPMIEMKKAFSIFNVNSSESAKIALEVGYIYTGMLELKILPEIIEKKVFLPQSLSYGVAYEINRRIFNRFPDYFTNSAVLLERWSKLKSNTVISEDEAWKKVLEIEPWILEEEQERQGKSPQQKQEEKYRPISEKLTIVDAMKKYTDFGEQLLTTDQIKLKHFQDPVRPSLKNWLADYTASLGYEYHDTNVRGNYLFQTENTKNLSYLDRQQLSQVLKSFDEKTPLEIDTQTKKIIFSQPMPERKPEPKPAPANIPTPAPPQYSARPIENTQPAYASITTEQKSSEVNTKTSSDMYVNAPAAPMPQPVYQPKTKEPGNGFEKVIQFEEKKSENTFSGNQRVVNLKEQEKERPILPKPPVKNLLNIKELIEISKEESQHDTPKPYSPPKTDGTPAMPIKKEQLNVSDRFNLQKITEKANQDSEKPLSAANNSIHHDYSSALGGTAWENSKTDSFNETEKKLFEPKSNAPAKEDGLKNISIGSISSEPAKDLSKVQKTDNSSFQFSSPQKLPHEKEQEEIQKKPVASTHPEPSQAAPMQPYRIHPASFEDN